MSNLDPSPLSSRPQKVVGRFQATPPYFWRHLRNKAAGQKNTSSLSNSKWSNGRCGVLHQRHDDQSDTMAYYQYHLSVLENVGSSTNLHSLRHILKSESKLCLSQRDRLSLALTLASSVLQLGGTQWLPKQWGTDQIFILLNQQPHTAAPTLDHIDPYVSYNTELAVPDEEMTSATTRYAPRNKILLSLGIVLMELCLGKPLEDMKIAGDCVINMDEASRQLTTARRQLFRIYGKAGENYGDVVERCLECPFDVPEAKIEDEEFEKEVFHQIVTPLSVDLSNSLGFHGDWS